MFVAFNNVRNNNILSCIESRQNIQQIDSVVTLNVLHEYMMVRSTSVV